MREIVDNPTVAHLWAHSSQETARNSNGSFYFNKNEIYSYGPHFRCAAIVSNHKNEKIYLVNTSTYSNTTAKHMSMVRKSIPEQTIVFNTKRDVTYGSNGLSHYHYRQALAFIVDQLEIIDALIKSQKTTRTIDYRNNVQDYLLNIINWIECWSLNKKRKSPEGKWLSPAITKLLSKTKEDRKTYWHVDQKKSNTLWEVPTKDCTHLQPLLRMIVDAELFQSPAANSSDERLTRLFTDHTNDPQLWTKFQARSELYRKREQQKERIAQMTFEEKQELWRKGEISQKWFDVPHTLGYNTILRVRNEKVETSKGITIYRQEAERLWKLIQVFRKNPTMFKHNLVEDANNHKWHINSYQNDILTAGCHRLPYKEIEYAAQQLGLTTQPLILTA